MASKLIVFATAAGCIGAAGVGSYLAVRSGPSGLAAPAAAATQTPGEMAAIATESPAAAPTDPAPVHGRAQETARPLVERSVVEPARPSPATRRSRQAESVVKPAGAASPEMASPQISPATEAPAAAAEAPTGAHSTAPETLPTPSTATAEPILESIEVPVQAVMGIRIDTTVSSERSKVEDPVTARLTRDVTVDGRTAIPAGTELVGHVSLVERGGRVRERARLGVKFTAMLLDGHTRVPIETPTIFREGEAKTGESSAKIGASAVIGGILGGLVGGKRGAAIGGAAGAAGGTAVVMSGDRSEASLTSGSTLTLRLSEPLVITRETVSPR